MEQKESPSVDGRYNRLKESDGSISPIEDTGFRFKPKTAPAPNRRGDGS